MDDVFLAALRVEPRPHWTSMRDRLDYIWSHPGSTKTAILRGTCTCRSRGGGDPVERPARRGLVYNLGRDSCHAWYVWQPVDRTPGTWENRSHP